MYVAPPDLIPWLAAVQSVLLSKTSPLFRRFNEGSFNWTTKAQGDLVTEIDLELQACLFDALSSFGVEILSEEGERAWPPSTHSDVVLLDPLDGTENFSSGIPCFGSMLTAIKAGRVWASVIWIPFEALQSRGGFYVGVRGKGAWHSSHDGTWRRLCISTAPPRMGYSLAIEGPQVAIGQSALPFRLAPHCRMQRMGLSSSWCGTRLASGSEVRTTIDAILTIGAEPWDTLPVALLVEEAGGRVSDLQGRPAGIDNCSDLLMASPQVHEQLLRSIHEG